MIHFLSRRQLLLVLAFLAVLLITSIFAVRAARQVHRLRPGVDEPIRPWMNVPYIAHSYRVPPPILFKALGLPPGVPDRRPIAQIAREQGRPVEAVIADLVQAIAEFRAGPPMPPPPPTPPPLSTLEPQGAL